MFVLGWYVVHFGLKAVGRSDFPGFPDPGNVLLEPFTLSPLGVCLSLSAAEVGEAKQGPAEEMDFFLL